LEKISELKGAVPILKAMKFKRIANLFERLTSERSNDFFYSEEVFHSILVREKARADRNGHGFSLVALEVSQNEDISPLVKKMQKKIRTSDEIGWFDHNTLGILLYNTSANGAWQFVDKNKNKPGDIFSICKYSVYSYPNEWCSF